MKKHLRTIAVVLACGVAIQLVPTPSAVARQPGMFFFQRQNQVLNNNLTPSMRLGQNLAIRNMLAYAASFGSLPLGSYGGYSYGFPYPMMYRMPGYPMPYGLMPAYAPGTGAMTGYGSAATDANTQQLATNSQPVNALDRLRKHGGGLDWPLGLRTLQPQDDSKELRQQIDDAVETMFHESKDGETTSKLLQQVAKGLDKLDRLYKANVGDMALTRQQEADAKQFVRKVKDALLAAEESRRRSDTELKTKASGQSQPYPKPPGKP